MLDAGEYSSSSSAECPMSCFNNNNNSSSSSCSSISKKKKTKNKRRFSDDQIKSLETIFDTETKLEPQKKLQLARELGLQPRQVAIWFQNKRARWKSKQLERDYTVLKFDYDNLAFQLDSLKKERQTLLDQLQKLNDLIDKSEAKAAGYEGCGHEASDHDGPRDSIGGGLVNDDNTMIKGSTDTGDAFEVKKTSPFLDFLEITEYGALNSDDDESIRKPDSYLGLEAEAAAELPLNILEPANSSSLTEPEEWGTRESDGLLDQPSNGCKWWDFWS